MKVKTTASTNSAVTIQGSVSIGAKVRIEEQFNFKQLAMATAMGLVALATSLP